MLKKAFSLVPEYLKTNEGAVKNGMDYGIQLGRRFRSLKLWFVMRYFGQAGLIERIREHCRLAKLLASWIEKSNNWELLAPVPFALVCFRACPKNIKDLDALNENLMNKINGSGKAYISHTKLNGKFTLRLSIGSLRVEERHIQKIWDLLNAEVQTETRT
jgi:aromatic-L-amino-acid decarboxylase